MICQEILEKRILIISGKGGVGKSVTASLLALAASQQGKRILLVELDTVQTLPQFFNQSAKEQYLEISLAPNITYFHIDGRLGLQEYLSLVLKSKRLVRKINQSPIYEYFVNIAPGLKELMAVGKLWHLEQKRLPGTNRPLYDLIIVDTPATGHTLSYLQMPMTAVNTVKKGFVKKEATKVVDLLQDPQRTSFNIVTTLAEMPVNETIELFEKVSLQLHLPIGRVFINQAYPPFFEGLDSWRFAAWSDFISKKPPDAAHMFDYREQRERILLSCAESWQRRRKMQEEQLKKLHKAVTCPMVTLPFVTDSEDHYDMIQKLTDELVQRQT